VVSFKATIIASSSVALSFFTNFITVNKTREAAGFAAKVLHLGSLYSLTVNTIPNEGMRLRPSFLKRGQRKALSKECKAL
jgi:hypothetical protein